MNNDSQLLFPQAKRACLSGRRVGNPSENRERFRTSWNDKAATQSRLTYVLSGISFLLLTCFFFAGCSKLPAEHTNITAANNEIRIPVKEINDGRVHFYTFKSSGKRINFFVRTDGTGALSASFDACFTCYKHKKGYRVEGTDLICNECNMKFPIADEKWDNTKGCSPIHLKSVIDDGFMTIRKEDLEKGGKLF